jgi:hypothetical protein
MDWTVQDQQRAPFSMVKKVSHRKELFFFGYSNVGIFSSVLRRFRAPSEPRKISRYFEFRLFDFENLWRSSVNRTLHTHPLFNLQSTARKKERTINPSSTRTRTECRLSVYLLYRYRRRPSTHRPIDPSTHRPTHS